MESFKTPKGSRRSLSENLTIGTILGITTALGIQNIPAGAQIRSVLQDQPVPEERQEPVVCTVEWCGKELGDIIQAYILLQKDEHMATMFKIRDLRALETRLREIMVLMDALETSLIVREMMEGAPNGESTFLFNFKAKAWELLQMIEEEIKKAETPKIEFA